MSEYQKDRRWSDQFIPQIKKIVGPELLDITPDEIDMKQAADLMIFTARDMKIAARIRRSGFADKYAYEFTIRSKRDTGAETELSKIVNGWGDYMFYGHDAGNGEIGVWWLINLNSFRAALIRHRRSLTMGNKDNKDGTYFSWFDLRSFPIVPPILVAGSMPLTANQKNVENTDLESPIYQDISNGQESVFNYT